MSQQTAGNRQGGKRRPAEKPDISFKTASTPLFPSPREYEESMIKSGHLIIDPDKLTAGKAIVSALSIIGACAAMFFIVRYIMALPPDEGARSAGFGNDFLSKTGVLYSGLLNVLQNGKPAAIAQSVGAWFGISLIGLLAGSCDILLSRIPPDGGITDRFGFGVSPVLRYLPAMTCTVYGVFVFVAEQIDDTLDFRLNDMNFSLTGEGYSWCTWVTEGFYLLLILAALFAVIEAFSNSGLWGLIVRLPLSVISNGAVIMVVMAGSLCAVLAALMFVMIKVVGMIIGIAFPRFVPYYRLVAMD